MITKAKKLTVLTCGHTTLDLELVVTGHNNPALVRHLMPCCHGPGEDGKIAHPIYAYIIEHETGRMMVDTGMSEGFRKDWKNNFYMERMAYDPGEDGSFTQRLAQQDLKPSDFSDWSKLIPHEIGIVTEDIAERLYKAKFPQSDLRIRHYGSYADLVEGAAVKKEVDIFLMETPVARRSSTIMPSVNPTACSTSATLAPS